MTIRSSIRAISALLCVDQPALVILVLLLQIPVLVEAHTLADLGVAQNLRRCAERHALLETLQSLPEALQMCGHKTPGVCDCTHAQLSQILGRQILRQTTLDDVGEGGQVDLFHGARHGVAVWQGFDEDGVDADALEFLGSGHGLVPAVDQRVCACEDEDVKAGVTGVDGGLDPSICFASADDGFAFGVAASWGGCQYVERAGS